jgi:hypothetical protein
MAYIGDRRGAYRVFMGTPEGKKATWKTGVDVRIILKRVFKKWNGEAWIESIWLWIGTGGGRLWML